MQQTRVQALVGEDPTCRRATKPMHHNYWACALEPASHNYWAHVPQLLKPTRLEPMLRNKRTSAMRSLRTTKKSSPRSLQLEKACAQQWRPNTAKKKKKKKKPLSPNRQLGDGLRTLVHHFPRLLASWIKQLFLFHQHLSLEYWPFKQGAAELGFGTSLVPLHPDHSLHTPALSVSRLSGWFHSEALITVWHPLSALCFFCGLSASP